MEERLRQLAREAPGFMPEPEGLALYEAAREAGRHGPLLAVGTYYGKSADYLGAAARQAGTVPLMIHSHPVSEGHQPRREHHCHARFGAPRPIASWPCVP